MRGYDCQSSVDNGLQNRRPSFSPRVMKAKGQHSILLQHPTTFRQNSRKLPGERVGILVLNFSTG
jgi:hypothetical protein